MREETIADKIWSIALIAFPALALILGSIPNFLPMYEGDMGAMVKCSLWNPPASNIMSNICPLLLIVFAYTLILTLCYYRSQALGTIKAIFIFSILCLVLSAMALLPHHTVQTMPYALIPILFVIMGIASFIKMQIEIKRFDF